MIRTGRVDEERDERDRDEVRLRERAKAQNRPNASVAPTGAENTALKIVASTAEASRTSPVL